MAEVFIPAPLRSLTAGQTTVTVRGAATVAEAVELLESRFPGVRERIIVDGSLRPGLQVTVDGAIAAKGLRHAVTDASEIHFLPAIGGG
ncbi:MAG: MoaD/ThiS family protein [Planctomycetales bacterium]|nr:MoaD/ThiS family protein [Planctomycetales bacterium]